MLQRASNHVTYSGQHPRMPQAVGDVGEPTGWARDRAKHPRGEGGIPSEHRMRTKPPRGKYITRLASYHQSFLSSAKATVSPTGATRGYGRNAPIHMGHSLTNPRGWGPFSVGRGQKVCGRARAPPPRPHRRRRGPWRRRGRPPGEPPGEGSEPLAPAGAPRGAPIKWRILNIFGLFFLEEKKTRTPIGDNDRRCKKVSDRES